MKRKSFPNIALTVILTLALAVCRILRTCIPFGVLPKLNIPSMVLLILAALLVEHYFGREEKCCNIRSVLAAALAFGLLPLAAGFVAFGEAGKLSLIGGVVFAVTAWAFHSMMDRLSTGPAAKAAPVLSAMGLLLAAQCFAGILI